MPNQFAHQFPLFSVPTCHTAYTFTVFFQDSQQQSTCKPCPSGYYCVANSSDYSHHICPPGHYCPNATEYDIEYPCPPGTYNPLSGEHDSSACIPCDPGQYCASPALNATTGPCDPGWYCVLGSALAQPSMPEGDFCVAGWLESSLS